MSTCILIIEDDTDLSRLLEISLQQHGYTVVTAPDGSSGLQAFESNPVDLLVLDIALPDMSGLEICRFVREQSDIPILIMSAHATTEESIAEGLNLGADEYMLKPLGDIEFPARINALLRRARLVQREKNSPFIYEDDYLSVNLNTRQVRAGDKDVRLTPTEFNLLATFLAHSGQVLTFQQILEKVWGEEYVNEHHYPRIYVSHLRRKIEPDFKNPTYIHNEYGVGYRFVTQNA